MSSAGSHKLLRVSSHHFGQYWQFTSDIIISHACEDDIMFTCTLSGYSSPERVNSLLYVFLPICCGCSYLLQVCRHEGTFSQCRRFLPEVGCRNLFNLCVQSPRASIDLISANVTVSSQLLWVSLKRVWLEGAPV